MMECKGFDLEGDSLRDSFASRASTLKQAIGEGCRKEGDEVRSLAFGSERAIAC